jgi:exonuclease SbcC
LDFEVGSTRYRVARRFPRKGAQTALLERFEEGTWIPELDRSGVTPVTRRIERLVGLDFEAFTRAVLLPQGDFHRFLRGKPTERKDILERLLDLGRYKLAGRRAGEIAKAHEGQARTLEAYIETTYAGVTPEQLGGLKAAYAQARKRAAQLKETDEKGGDLLRAISEAESLLVRQSSVRSDLDKLGETLLDLDRLGASLEPRRTELRSDLAIVSEQLKRASAADQTARESLQKVIAEVGDSATLVRLEQSDQTLQAALEEGVQIREDLERVRQSVQLLGVEEQSLTIEVGRLKAVLAEARERVDRTQKSLQTAREAVTQAEALRQASADVERVRLALQEDQRSLESLSLDRERRAGELPQYSSNVEATRERETLAAANLHAAQELLRRARLVELKRLELVNMEQDFQRAERELAAASAEEIAAAEVLATARKRLQDLEHANLAAVLRGKLSVGEPCPVCEHPVHELPPPVEPAEAAIRSAEEEVKKSERRQSRTRATVDEARSKMAMGGERLAATKGALLELGEMPNATEAKAALEGAERARATAAAQHEAAQHALSNAQLELRGAERAYGEREVSTAKLEPERREAEGRASIARQALSVAFPQGVPDDLATIVAEAERIFQEAKGRLQKAQADVSAGESSLGSTVTLLGERRSLLNRIETDLHKVELKASSAMEVLSEAFPEGLPRDAEAEIRGRQARLGDAESLARDARTVLEGTRAALEDLQNEGKGLDEEAARLSTAAATVAGRLTGLAAEATKAGVVDAPKPETAAVEAADLTALRTWTERLRKELDSAIERCAALKSEKQMRLETLVREATGRLSEGKPAEALRRQLAEAIERATQVATEAKNAVSVFKEKLANIEETQRQIQELRTSAERHHRLWVDLKSDNFLDFLLRESFQDLAAAASIELRRVSGGRYSLVSKGSDFLVVDHENADESRSVITLSGGETFLASLSLALSLAGAVQDLAGTAAASRLDAIFIDEGFGALDPSALGIVIDALERLQEGDRMVGVITHVKELAERIPAGLEIQPGTAGTGSRVIPRA